jgi:hypothetical protein
MWVLVLAVLVRFVFVLLIAKYQLCNPHGETVVDSLVRLHPWYASFLVIASIVTAHVCGAYMLVGCDETWIKFAGVGATWQWSLLWVLAAPALVFRPEYQRVETFFKVILAASLIGSAIWVGPNPTGVLHGAFGFALPQTVGMFGALGGCMMNLTYPYFLEMKGWRGPAYRRLHTCDLLPGVFVMILLNLAVWTLGAELVHGSNRSVEGPDGLVSVLGDVLGSWGERLLLIGVFSAVFTACVGISMPLIASNGVDRRRGDVPTASVNTKSTPVYRAVILWALISPMIWTLPGMPDFVLLTVIANSLQVLLVPILAGGLWRITASEKHIGRECRNRLWNTSNST